MKKLKGICLMLLLAALTGCGKASDETTTQVSEDAITLYYIDEENMTFCEASYHCTDPTATMQSVEEITKQLFTRTDWNQKYTLPLPDFMSYKSYEMAEEHTVVLYMDISYQDDTKGLEVLCKAAIVKSICQLEYVEKVTFELNNLAITDAEGIVTETYTSEDFVVSSSDGSYVQNGEIEIYFANADGTALKEYRKVVQITNNVSLEQVVIDALLTGPARDGYTATIPEGTVLNKISVKDGTAYVNFNENFNGSASDIRSDLTLYSVVNSLCNLPTISRVQILINGEKQEMYRETIDISNTLERNLELIEQEE